MKAWHRYSLQALPISRFAQAVTRVIRGDDYVVSLAPEMELKQKYVQSGEGSRRENKK